MPRYQFSCYTVDQFFPELRKNLLLSDDLSWDLIHIITGHGKKVPTVRDPDFPAFDEHLKKREHLVLLYYKNHPDIPELICYTNKLHWRMAKLEYVNGKYGYEVLFLN